MQSFDIETGSDTELLNLNPEGWIEGVSNERNWGMLYGMDVSWHHNMIIAGDSHGVVHAVDPRANQPIIGKHQLHKKGNKVGMLSHSLVLYTSCPRTMCYTASRAAIGWTQHDCRK